MHIYLKLNIIIKSSTMEENHNSLQADADNGTMLNFDSPKEQSSYIKVIGVGGGGGNAVNNMYAQGIKGVDFIVCNTDMKALNSSPVPNKIVLGNLGAGNIPQVAHDAAMEHKDEIREAISTNTEMLFITAGMGGGTGTGAAPVIAEIAKSIELDDPNVPHILVVAVVTVPFTFEGRRRRQQAEEGVKKLRENVDSILIINNDKLRSLGNLSLSEAFKQADDVLLTAVKGIAEIITVSDYINIDFHDVNTVMQNSGTALMGTGIGKGENRAQEAIEMASTSVLLNDNNIAGAKNVLLYFSYPPAKELSMDEMDIVTEYLCELTGRDMADVIWGAGSDDSLSEELKITLIATGFESRKEPKVISIDGQVQNSSKGNQPRKTLEVAEQASLLPKPEATRTTDPASGWTVIHRTEAEHVAQPADIAEPQHRMHNAATPTWSADANEAVSMEQHTDAPHAEAHHYDLYGNILEDQPQNNAADPAHTNKEEPHYADGINIIHRSEAETAEASASSPAPQPRTQQPVAHREPEPLPVIAKPYVAPMLSTMEPKAPQHDAVTGEPAPFAGNEANNQDAVIQRAGRIKERMNERKERIRRMNELLHSNPDAPRIVENLTTAELTSDEIYVAPHSSESDAHKTTTDSQGNIKSWNSFLYDRPD